MFTLTFEQFASIISQPCCYCGEDIKPRGIDRWDNSIGYELENSRSCCWVCNDMKGDMDGPTFVEHIQRMADHTRAVEDSDFHQIFLNE